MDFIPIPADPEHQRALPDDLGAWRRNGTHPRHLVVLSRLLVQHRQRQQTFRALMADLYSDGLRALARILARFRVGAATRW